jgi:excisionase family DNA binding protein
MENSTILHNLTPERLQEIVRDAVKQEIQGLKLNQDEAKYLTRSQVAKLLHISLPTLQTYVTHGIIKAHRIGHRVLFDEQDVILAIKEIPSLKYNRR